MITLKEYEIYLKVKKFIETIDITLYWLQLEDVGSLSKRWFMPIGIGVRE